ncbi:hypothetical protein [Siphonobacter curvatus]|uniref:hypothetical protein n=1 Tax=Siphonobacter curvatus TaxID=2094562 RepID=UPI0013FDBE64|nr:hypothetical protein [Siphonobacter curvatus]
MKYGANHIETLRGWQVWIEVALSDLGLERICNPMPYKCTEGGFRVTNLQQRM